MLQTKLLKLIVGAVSATPLRRYFFPRHRYAFSVPQLLFLCQCLAETRDIPGAIAEVGCAYGFTTVFLNNYMDAEGIDKKYYAMDTFTGFVPADVAFEVERRHKRRQFFEPFQVNKRSWFDKTMRQNGIKRVVSVEGDVNELDFSQFGPLSFVLLDVDLYRPIRKCLKELHALLSPGGIIVVDDCSLANERWDGAFEAYKEFVREMDIPEDVVHGKLGIVRKAVAKGAGQP